MSQPNVLDCSVLPPDATPWMPSPENYWWRPKLDRYIGSDVLLPGDVLLFRPRKPTLPQKLIIQTQQRNGAPLSHAAFTHAAIYIGVDHLVSEAVITRKLPPSGRVRVGSIEGHLQAADLLTRRLPGLSIEQRHEICLLAAGSRDEKYDVKAVVAYFFGRNDGLDEPARRSVVCSTLCSRILTKVGALTLPAEQISLHSSSDRAITPADLSLTPNLMDVPLPLRHAGS